MGLAVSQAHRPPAQNADLIVCLADFHRFSFSAYSERMVNVVNAVFQPHSAVTAHLPNGLDSFLCGGHCDAVVSHLPAGLVGDFLAELQGQAVVVSQLANGANVNHCFYFLSLGGLPSLFLYLV